MNRLDAVNRLFLIWMFITLPFLLWVTANSVVGKYEDNVNEVWSWLLSQTVPISCLLIAAVFSQPTRNWSSKPVNQFRYKCAVGFSLLQGTIICAIFVIEPIATIDMFEFVEKSSILSSIIQGIVISAVSAVVFDGR